MLYEARMSFTHPGVDSRFRQGLVYDLDDDAVDVLAGPIEKGRLTPVDENGRRITLPAVVPAGESPHPVGVSEPDARDGDGGSGSTGLDNSGPEPRPLYDADDVAWDPVTDADVEHPDGEMQPIDGSEA